MAVMFEQWGPEETAEKVADVVTQSGRQDRDRYHLGDFEFPLEGEIACEKQHRLAGKRQAGVFEHHTEKNHPVAVLGKEFRERVENCLCHRTLLLCLSLRGLKNCRSGKFTVWRIPVLNCPLPADGATPTGMSPEEFTRRLEEAGADVIGLNCGVGPARMLETLKRMAAVTARKLSVQPNAGVPRGVEGRTIYESSPESMAEYSGRFVQAGAAVVGGCCGTTPDHIRMIREAVHRET